MPEKDRLVDQLATLDESDFVDVIERARRRRVDDRPPVEDSPPADWPGLARWYATSHLRVEPNVREAIYLPAGAPDGEIRLLEVNVASRAPVDAPIEVIDFGVDMDLPTKHRLLVAEVTPEQWERVKNGAIPLPEGWSLADYLVFGRRGRGR